MFYCSHSMASKCGCSSSCRYKLCQTATPLCDCLTVMVSVCYRPVRLRGSPPQQASGPQSRLTLRTTYPQLNASPKSSPHSGSAKA